MKSSLAVAAILTLWFGFPGDAFAGGFPGGSTRTSHFTVEPSAEGAYSPMNLGQPDDRSRRTGPGIGEVPSGSLMDDLIAEESEVSESDPTESCGPGLMPVISWDVSGPGSLIALPFVPELKADSTARSVLRC